MALYHVKPGEIANLNPLGDNLRQSKTRALAKTDTFEAMRLVIPAGMEIAPHDVRGAITLHCLEGRVLLKLDPESIELAAGDWIYLEGGKSHALKGVEDSSLLLTILFVA